MMALDFDDAATQSATHNLHALPCQPNADAMRTMVALLFRDAPAGMVELAWTSRTKPYPLSSARLFALTHLEELVDAARLLSAEPNRNVYISAGLRREDCPRDKRAKDADVLAVSAAKVDFDKPGAYEAALGRLASQGLMPNAIVITGRHPHVRAQLWFVMDEPAKDLAVVSEIERRLALWLDADTSITNPSRVMRLAGSVAWPLKEGRKLEMTELVINGVRIPPWSLDELKAAVREAVPLDGPADTKSPGKVFGFNTAHRQGSAQLDEYVAASREPGQWHSSVLRAIAHLTRKGAPPDAIISLLAHALVQPGYSLEQTRAEIHIMVEGAIKRGFVPAGDGEDPKEGARASPRDPLPVPLAWAGVDAATIPRRRWLYGRYLCRGILSLTVSPGGVGKSSLALIEALQMATGHKLHDQALPGGAVRVWYINLEDPQDELDRRTAGACLHYGVRHSDLAGRLFINSGVETPLKLAGLTAKGQGRLDEAAFAHVEEQIRASGIDAIIVDPFVSSHDLPESDNGMIDRLAKRWSRLAMRCDVAVGLIHHTKKQAAGQEYDADSARGASALINAGRVVRVLNPMTEAEAKEASIRPELRRLYFRASRAKQNLAPPDADKNWYRMVGVTLGNGTPPANADADEVAVATRWIWPADAVAAEAERVAVERKHEVRRQVLDGLVACLGSAWIAPREVFARLQEAGVVRHGRNRVIDVLQTLSSDASDGVIALQHGEASIEVETQRTAKRTNLRFRVLRHD